MPKKLWGKRKWYEYNYYGKNTPTYDDRVMSVPVVIQNRLGAQPKTKKTYVLVSCKNAMRIHHCMVACQMFAPCEPPELSNHMNDTQQASL
jgi:hypothetical protein